ncbi:MAG: carboxylating nicotinate-nucleotide diphosphorylase [Acidimicrobiia bacterium]
MSEFDPPVTARRSVIAAALAEDLGMLGDLTSLACIPDAQMGSGTIVARAAGVLAGTVIAAEVFASLDPSVVVSMKLRDGQQVSRGDVIGTLDGSLRSILMGERTCLNLLSHCSGVATLTRMYVDAAAVEGSVARIRETRKTIPGLRALQKAAVRAGGGVNHRESLSDAVLVKDNHLVALGSVTRAVEQSRERWPGRTIEVECDSIDQVAEAKAAGADLVLLDNMAPAMVRDAVALLGGAPLAEVSGGVNLETVAEYAATGVAFISIGALTHSAPALDIALDLDANLDAKGA